MTLDIISNNQQITDMKRTQPVINGTSTQPFLSFGDDFHLLHFCLTKLKNCKVLLVFKQSRVFDRFLDVLRCSRKVLVKVVEASSSKVLIPIKILIAIWIDRFRRQ